jgi:methyl-accepting chemotaxis protein
LRTFLGQRYLPAFSGLFLAGGPSKMFHWSSKRTSNDASAQLAALYNAQAVIEFSMDGKIVTANKNVLDVLGYTLEEIQGKHHRMFVDPNETGTAAYREFWGSLNRGEFQAAEFKRFAKDGREV